MMGYITSLSDEKFCPNSAKGGMEKHSHETQEGEHGGKRATKRFNKYIWEGRMTKRDKEQAERRAANIYLVVDGKPLAEITGNCNLSRVPRVNGDTGPPSTHCISEQAHKF